MTVSKNTENDTFDCDFTYILIRAQLHGSSHVLLGVGSCFNSVNSPDGFIGLPLPASNVGGPGASPATWGKEARGRLFYDTKSDCLATFDGTKISRYQKQT